MKLGMKGFMVLSIVILVVIAGVYLWLVWPRTPEPTPVPPSAVPPTDTVAPPTATPVPPTVTPVPPTATIPPTVTPVPPTATARPTHTPTPTNTPALIPPKPTETPEPPQALPITGGSYADPDPDDLHGYFFPYIKRRHASDRPDTDTWE